MKNLSLAGDYIFRAEKRLKAIKVLFDEDCYADVVREAQECVELALKGLLRSCSIEVPRVHDVSEVLISQKSILPRPLQSEVEYLCDISRALRRDRELAFYGSEDLTPSTFYKEKDAKIALAQATDVVKKLKPFIK